VCSVSESDREPSKMRRSWPTGAVASWKKFHVFPFVNLELLRTCSPAVLPIQIQCEQHLVFCIGSGRYDRIRPTVLYT
jgi:hypothetical protein